MIFTEDGTWRVRIEFIIPDSENDPSLWEFESLLDVISENPGLVVHVNAARLVPIEKESKESE
tara:strand:- start:6302 stop:6490 length:189 start_codon:yes stop_codon:yes gene_type:complete